MLNWLYPPTCMGCASLLPVNDAHRASVWLCAACEALLRPIAGRVEKKGGVRCYAQYAYEGILRDVIRGVKFRGKKGHMAALGRLWARGLNEGDLTGVLVPMPLHRNKERARGFNQAGVLAQALSAGLGIGMAQALVRRVDTAPQAGLHRSMRAENVAGAFAVAKGYTPSGKSFILVDDIYTTGASLNECARVLWEHGATQVAAIALAATLPKEDEHA